jgi:uncharacterized protein YbjT (DUF2867 family)
MNGKTIAVAGATGQQGGAVARRMLAEGWRVRALTRDPSKPQAQELAGLGAEVVPGDMEQPAQLEAAFKGPTRFSVSRTTGCPTWASRARCARASWS